MKKSYIEKIILNRVEVARLPMPEKEYRFHPVRKWRFDFAYPVEKIAIEAEGAIWANGRHTRGSGFNKDCEKYNAAAILGWRVLRYTTSNIDQLITDLKQIKGD